MDKKALSILKKYYGGHPYTNKLFETTPAKEQFEYCFDHGTMFDKTAISHHEIIRKIKELANSTTLEAVAKAFLYSLSTGAKEYRSALSSYIYAVTMPVHEVVLSSRKSMEKHTYCTICGFGYRPYVSVNLVEVVDDTSRCEVDWNRYSCNKLHPGEWTDLCQPEYVMLDLQEFIKLPPVEPCDEDYYILNRILGEASKCTSYNKGNALVKMIKQENILVATNAEIHTLLGVLGMCGVFETPENKGYFTTFQPFAKRGFENEIDKFYPFCFWRGNCGINDEAVDQIFSSFSGKQLAIDKRRLVNSNDKPTSVKNNERKIRSTAEKYFVPGEYIVDLTNEERRYFGLEELRKEYDVEYCFSRTYGHNKRTTLVYSGDNIVKIIYEEHVLDKQGQFIGASYTEYDTNLRTEGRVKLLPLTNKGHVKSVTSTNVMSMPATGFIFGFQTGSKFCDDGGTQMAVTHGINSKDIAIGEFERISAIRTREDFHEFMNWYMNTCPEDYFDRIDLIKKTKHQTVKFKAGDIFRCEYDRFHYCYGLIIGKTRDIEKWDTLPKEHSFRWLMSQPIMVRMYDFVTTKDNMSPEELQNIPLRNLQICVDNEIIWGIHPVVAHKKLIPSDVQFHFNCIKIMQRNRHKTLYTDDFLMHSGLVSGEREFKLYIEWGFGQVELLYENISEEIKEFMREYSNAHGGVSLGIDYLSCGISEEEFFKKYPKHILRGDLLNNENKEYLKMIFRCLGISEDTDLDDFAKRYRGITRQEFIDRIQG